MIREGRAPTEAWLPSDRLLSVALTLYDRNIASCGHPMDAYEPGADWSAKRVVCAGCAAEENERAAKERPAPGEKVFAVNATTATPMAGEVLPTFD